MQLLYWHPIMSSKLYTFDVTIMSIKSRCRTIYIYSNSYIVKMARIHVHTHGKSHSTRPTSKGPALWLSQNRDQISALVVDFAKEGLSPSEIGIEVEGCSWDTTCQTCNGQESYEYFGRERDKVRHARGPRASCA